MILVEGPSEANGLIPLLRDPDLQPPVAILAYRSDKPSKGVFYPFASFSPEWQALTYGLETDTPVQFFDLPIGYWLDDSTDRAMERSFHVGDPLDDFARITGKPDGERWWEEMVESRRSDGGNIFAGIQLAMTSLREAYPENTSPRDLVREAWMRQEIRRCEKDGCKSIAVVCGAWHGPALESMPPAKQDLALLKGKNAVKIETTWIPWTFARLTFASGYGAGLVSPGWYRHIWEYPEDDGVQWLSRAAEVLREAGKDTSTAHVVEAVRLASTLAGLRNLSRPGLQEFDEAVVAVMGMGDSIWLELLKKPLVIGEDIGQTPLSSPKVPLVKDVEGLQKKLRLTISPEEKSLILDLRKDNDLARSRLLHRLNLLGIPWGKSVAIPGQGTFKEQWNLSWHPEYHILLIEKGFWGNTLSDACAAFLEDRATHSQSIPEVVKILEDTILADLPKAMESLIQRLGSLAAASPDLSSLMKSVAGLTRVLRYGDVRQTQFPELNDMLAAMTVRVCIGYPFAVIGIADDIAQSLVPMVRGMDESIGLSEDSEHLDLWSASLAQVGKSDRSHPLLAGLSMQLAYRRHQLSDEWLDMALQFYFSAASDPGLAAQWLEGFLSASGSILLIDPALWKAVFDWIECLPEERFLASLPVLRRTFSEFSPAEKRKIGEKAKSGSHGTMNISESSLPQNNELGIMAAHTVLALLGIQPSST